MSESILKVLKEISVSTVETLRALSPATPKAAEFPATRYRLLISNPAELSEFNDPGVKA
jgi:hypothetical protein